MNVRTIILTCAGGVAILAIVLGVALWPRGAGQPISHPPVAVAVQQAAGVTRPSASLSEAAKSPIVDVDKDGLADAWEMKHFGTLEYGAMDCPAGDGIPNHLKYHAGLDPWRKYEIRNDPKAKFNVNIPGNAAVYFDSRNGGAGRGVGARGARGSAPAPAGGANAASGPTGSG